ncbi:hypothetical protein CP970_07985 [Streptomyces kanamyceticus]|uniref:Uncharacterized protein n=1 Tax=Streptomyces kanamyceticus TaxID=1967 RepID=A0A5J6GA71_STRKN|nr:hypothetical protein CP970_07985 [Streptomyces kanamyceticus]
MAIRAAFAGRGADLVEVRGQVVAHCLAVPAQAAGDRADGPVAFAKLMDVGVPLADAGQELAVGWVGRLRRFDQGCQDHGIRRLCGFVQITGLGVFSQAGAVLVGGAFDRAGERAQQMPAICCLDRASRDQGDLPGPASRPATVSSSPPAWGCPDVICGGVSAAR